MVDLVGDSTGGGMVETVTVDGFPYKTLGDAFVLLVQDPQEALSDETLERLRAELPDVVDAQTVRVDGRGVLYAFALPVEPDARVVARGARRRRAGACGCRCCGRCCRSSSQPDRKPQLFDTMTRWRELAAERDVAALGGRRPVRDGRFRLAAHQGRRPHARALTGHAPADARRVRGGRVRPGQPVQAGLRRPLGEARRDAGARQRRHHGADDQVRVRRRRRRARRRERAGAHGRRGRLHLRRPQRRPGGPRLERRRPAPRTLRRRRHRRHRLHQDRAYR